MRKKNKYIALILAILVGLTGVEIPVFAGNNDSLPTDPIAGDGGGARDGFNYDDSYVGIRVSMYWAPTLEEFNKGAKNPTVIQIGKSTDLTTTGPKRRVEVYTRTNIFQYMGKRGKEDYTAQSNTITPYTYANPQEVGLYGMPHPVNGTKAQWDNFFEGPVYPKDGVNIPTYQNIPKISMLLGANITSEDFAAGILRTDSGTIKQGVYKIYFEPIFFPKVKGRGTVMTLRDAIRWQEAFNEGYIKANENMVSALSPMLQYLANGQFLIEDEPTIAMSGNKGGALGPGFNEIRAAIAKGSLVKKKSGNMTYSVYIAGKAYASMGVGVVTTKPRKGDVPKVVKSYVQVVGVDSNGKLIFKEYAPTTVGAASIDKNTSFIDIPKVENVEGGRAVINDVVVSPKDMTKIQGVQGDSIAWEENSPKLKQGDTGIQLTSEDISQYLFGVITGEKTFVDKVTVGNASNAGTTVKARKQEGKRKKEVSPGIVLGNVGAGLVVGLIGDKIDKTTGTSTDSSTKGVANEVVAMPEKNLGGVDKGVVTGKKESAVSEVSAIEGVPVGTITLGDIGPSVRDVAEGTIKEIRVANPIVNLKAVPTAKKFDIVILMRNASPQEIIDAVNKNIRLSQARIVELQKNGIDSSIEELVKKVEEGEGGTQLEWELSYLLGEKLTQVGAENKGAIENTFIVKVMKALETVRSRQSSGTNGRKREIASEESIKVKVTPKKEGGIPVSEGNYNVTYLRYIVVPESMQINIVERTIGGKPAVPEILVNKLPLLNTPQGYIAGVLQDIRETDDRFKDAEVVKWYSNTIYEREIGKIPPSDGKYEGKEIVQINNLTTDENIYVYWKIALPDPELVVERVPEWRISKYNKSRVAGVASMSFSLGGCECHRELSPEHSYSGNYITINPNDLETENGYNPENGNLKTKINHPWYHSKVIDSKTYSSITKSSAYADVQMWADLNHIKSSESSGLVGAKWVGQNKNKELERHNVVVDIKPKGYKGDKEYEKTGNLVYKIKNIATYVEERYRHRRNKHGSWVEHSGTVTTEPEDASYSSGLLRVQTIFERFVPKKKEIEGFKDVKKEENGKTTIAIEEKAKIGVYPEVPMLFADDKGTTSVEFVVGEEKREIQPVTWHTMQYKLFVEPTSVGTAVATDTRAQELRGKMGMGSKQVIYKGAGVNQTYKVKQAKGNNESGLLIVKTYAIDLNNATLKKEWGNGGYDTKKISDNFLNSWSFAGDGKSRIEIVGKGGGEPTYVGPLQVRGMKYQKQGNTVTTDYLLTVRSGKLTHVDGVEIDKVKTGNPEVYEALEGMKLVGDKTVLGRFETGTGAKLTEKEFAEKAKAVRNGIADLKEGHGWYTEDSTVLKITQYTTKYAVPNTGYTDKIPMTVKGLETPIDKNTFFSEGAYGHSYVKYSIKNTKPLGEISEVFSYFESASRENGKYSEVVKEYVVPNVTITDTIGY